MDPPRLYQLISGWGYPAAWHDIDALDPRAAVSDSVPPVIIGFAVKILKNHKFLLKKTQKIIWPPKKHDFMINGKKLPQSFLKLFFFSDIVLYL